MSVLWATRGYDWGFRFVVNEFSGDPLPLYESAIAQLQAETGDTGHLDAELVVVRFYDPAGRRDQAGRRIQHTFVVGGSAAVGGFASVAAAQQELWQRFGPEYARIWKSEV